jgi:hypothetical protein
MKPTYEYKGRQLTIRRLACLPECKVCYQVVYNRVVTLKWPIEKALTTLTGPQKKKAKEKAETDKIKIDPFKKTKQDREIIAKEKLKQIFKKPVKPTSTYVYWVQGSYRGVL